MATRSLNRVQLIGNLTRDPELRYTSSGTAIATFTVATNRNYQDSNGNNVETAEFTNVVAWAKLAEICGQLLKKGMKVYIDGRLQTQRWEDKETGKDMRRTEVVATDMIILTPSGSKGDYDNGDDDSNNGGNNDNNDMGENVDFSSFEEMDGDNKDDGDNSTPF